MAANRGLNKGRGLGALIPRNLRKEKQEEDKSVDITQNPAPAASKPTQKKKKPEAAKKTTKEAGKKQEEEKETADKKKKGTTEKKKANETKKEKTTLAGKRAKKTAAPATTGKTAGKAGRAEPAVKEKKESAKTNPRKTRPAVEKDAKNTEQGGLLQVRLTRIVPARKQPRKVFDEEKIEELAGSIREHGIVTPLLVRKQGDYYELIAGERRWRAARKAGLKEVPVLLKDLSEQETMEIALIDNLQREDLNAIEEARAYQSLGEEFGLTQEEIAGRVSKSRTAVTNSLRLLKLDEAVQGLLIEGKISMGHARALLALEDPELQRVTAERVAETQLSVRETEKLVRRLQNPGSRTGRKAPDPQIAAVYADLEEQLRKAVGTRVSIHPLRGKKGKIEIEYYSDDDLERIIDRLR